MSALLPDEFKIGRAISSDEWAELRRASLYGLPEAFKGMTSNEIFLGYQKKSLRERAKNTVTFIEKSRRTGLTWAFAADAVTVAASATSAGGMDVWYIGYNLEMAREFIDVCGQWARLFADGAMEAGEFVFEDYDEKTRETRQIKAFRVRFSSGFEIVALPSSPRSLRGKAGYVIIDEAAFHDDLAELLKAALALTIWGGMVVVISTHNGENNPFNSMIKEIRAGQKRYGLVRIDFDDALRDGLYQRICLKTGTEWTPEDEASWRSGIIDDYGDGADEELFVIPSEGSGVWLLPAVVEACMDRDVPVLRFEQPDTFVGEPEVTRRAKAQAWLEAVVEPEIARCDESLASFFGQDFGRIADLSVIWPVQIGRGLMRKTPFVIELRNIPFDQQEQIVFFICDRLPRFCGGALDAGGNGAALAEKTAQRYGLERIAQVKFSIDWYRENMPKYKATLEARGMNMPADPYILDDHKLIKLINGVARVPTTRSVEKGDAAAAGKKKRRHGDSAIAGALAHFASLMPIIDYDYMPVSSLKNDSPFDATDFGGRTIW
jgi:phage FluMu gp28-like protein